MRHGLVIALPALAVAGLALCLAAAPADPGAAPARGPDAGDPAPAFTLPGSDGKSYSLADFKGKRAVVIAWFPKAFTGG
jgi:peroxiredoxin Q/BCP